MIQWWFLMKTGRAQRPLIFRYRGASGRQSIRQVYNWTESKQFIVGDDIDVAGTGGGQRRETKRRTFRKDRIEMWANEDWNQLRSHGLRSHRASMPAPKHEQG